MKQTQKKSSQSIKTKSSVQDHNLAVRIFASIVVALSGLILFSDKVLTITLQHNFGFKDTETFLWVFTQSISPFLWGIAGRKSFLVAHTVPIYFYTIQLIWVFNSNLKLDNEYLHIYASGTVLCFVVSAIVINAFLKHYKTNQERRISFLEKALDFSLNLNKKNDHE